MGVFADGGADSVGMEAAERPLVGRRTPLTSRLAVGRVGALAVALGVGAAVFALPGLAVAETGGSSGASGTSSSSGSSADSAGEATDEGSGTSPSGEALEGGGSEAEAAPAEEQASAGSDGAGAEMDGAGEVDGEDDAEVDLASGAEDGEVSGDAAAPDDTTAGAADDATTARASSGGSTGNGSGGGATAATRAPGAGVPSWETDISRANQSTDATSPSMSARVAPMTASSASVVAETVKSDLVGRVKAAAPAASSTTTAFSTGLISEPLRALELSPGSGAGGNTQPWDGSVLAAVLAWVRREIDRLFFNKTPTAHPAQMSQTGDGVVRGTLNAADANEDPLVFKVTSAPLHGTVVVNSEGLYTYTSNPDFAATGGTDSFTVRVRDTGLHLNFWVPSSISVTVPITVVTNVAPVEIEPTTVLAPSRSTGLVSGLVHVSDPNGNPLTYTVTTVPEKGAVTVDELGHFVYKPTEAARKAASARNASAGAKNDFFEVTASDGAAAVAVPVSVPVAPLNDTKVDSIQVGAHPQAVVFAPDGTRAYLANLDGTVSVIDAASRTVVGRFEVGNQPDGLAISPDGTKLYVAQSASGSLSVVDAVSGAIVGEPIPVGASPGPVVVDSSRDFVYVANVNSQNVSAIAIADGSVTNITVGTSPSGLAASPDGSKVFVANFGDGTVSTIDTTTNEVVGEPIAVMGNPSALAMSVDGQALYVTDFRYGSLTIIDFDDMSQQVISVGMNPSAVVASADGTRVYVVNSGDNTVSVIDTGTRKLLGTIEVGTLPSAAAFSPDGAELYVADNTGTVSVISVVQSLSNVRNSTDHFEVYNHTSQPIVYKGPWSGGGDIDGGPSVGTIIDPGDSVGFEVIYHFLSASEVLTSYRTVDTNVQFAQSMYVGPLNSVESTCSAGGSGMQCDAGGRGIYMLDAPSTVITIPGDNPDAQSAFLQKYCYDGSPMSCTFTGTRQLQANAPEHSTGIIIKNGGPTKVIYDHIRGYSASSSSSITVGGSVSVSIKEIVDLEIHAEYGHEWGEEYTWENSLSIPIKGGWQAELLISDAIYINYGNFILTMGNTTWILTDAIFTSPDPSGNSVWRVAQEQCKDPQCLTD